MMNGRRKSDSCIVPTKSANKLTPVVRAEQMEGRRLVEGNAEACSMSRTLRRPRHVRGTNPHTIGDVYANRHNLRQEPDALEALVRICGGGAQQCASLLRLMQEQVTISATCAGSESAPDQAPLQFAPEPYFGFSAFM